MKLPKRVSNKRYLTISIHESVVRVGKVNGKGNKFDHFSEYKLPPGLVANGIVQNADGFAQFLASVKKASKQKDEQVIVGVSELKATTHTLTMPMLTDDEMDQAIRRQSESFLPFPYKDEYVDWMQVKELPDKQQRILLSALPRDVVDELSEAFEKAGYKPVAFENASLSLYRLIPDVTDKPSIVVLQDDFVTICMLGTQGSAGACSVIQERAQINEKLPKLINYYLQKNQAVKRPDTIYLAGFALSQPLVTMFTNQYKFNVVPLTAGISNIPNNRQMELATFASLARKQVAPPDNPKTINIVPETIGQEYARGTSKPKHLVAKLIAFFALMVSVGIGVYLLIFLMQREREIKRFQSVPPSENAAATAVALTKLDIMNQTMTANEPVLMILDLVQDKDNGGVRLTGANYSAAEKEVIISGFAATRNRLLTYKEKLEETKLFESVSIPVTSLQEEFDITFRIELTFAK